MKIKIKETGKINEIKITNNKNINEYFKKIEKFIEIIKDNEIIYEINEEYYKQLKLAIELFDNYIDFVSSFNKVFNKDNKTTNKIKLTKQNFYLFN